MIITYHIIALKYRKSAAYSGFRYTSRIFLISLHIFIVVSNILLYFWLIINAFNPISMVLSIVGILIFVSGLFIIFWGGYSLKKAVFIPGNKLVTTGAFFYMRHPMYLGGILGALGLSLFAYSLLGLVYSFVLAAVLSHIADAEEEDLKAKFGEEYVKYQMKVPKLFPQAW